MIDFDIFMWDVCNNKLILLIISPYKCPTLKLESTER